MKAKVDTIENPLSGERITFLTTGEQSGGEFVKVRAELSAGTSGPPLHYHLAFTETFEVIEGKLDLYVGGKKNHVVLECGESTHAPLRIPHTFWNGSGDPAVFECEMRPACRFERSMRTAFGLAREGRPNEAGVPRNVFWELALLYEFSESYVVGMPLFLQRAVFGALAAIARLKSYDPEFSRYAAPEGTGKEL